MVLMPVILRKVFLEMQGLVKQITTKRKLKHHKRSLVLLPLVHGDGGYMSCVLMAVLIVVFLRIFLLVPSTPVIFKVI